MADLGDLLRAAVASGNYAPLRERLADGAVLRTSSERGRQVVRGADAVVAHLSGPGPGDVAHWDAREWETGAAITFEWHGASGADRRRWYLRRTGGEVVEMWSAAARPGAKAEPVSPPEDLVPGARIAPLTHGGNSGAALLRAERPGSPSLILKRVTAGGDWLARVTGDDGRTARMHHRGIFDAIPQQIRHGIVDVRRDGDTAWIVMEDVGALLLDEDRRISREESRRVMAAAAAMHDAFRDEALPGAATLAARLGMSSPVVAVRERGGTDLLPKQFEHAWEAFAELVDTDVAEAVLQAVLHPETLARRLFDAFGGWTLIHGDLRDDNLGFDGDRIVLIDWDLATVGTPTVDFAWYLAQDAWRIDATHDDLEADHHAAHPGLDPNEIELGMLSGLVQYGWLLAHSARVHPDPAETAWGRAELAWWVPRVRRALEALA
jgi:hypothetical protein